MDGPKENTIERSSRGAAAVRRFSPCVGAASYGATRSISKASTTRRSRCRSASAMGSEGFATTRRRERSGEEVTAEMMIIGASLGILLLALMAWLI